MSEFERWKRLNKQKDRLLKCVITAFLIGTVASVAIGINDILSK
jgi:hypothetical protein